MLFLKTLRVDESDTHVFERAAEPGEWAITGTFAFVADDPEGLTGKRRQAFRNGFLGTDSFSWSTLVSIATILDDEYASLIERLGDHLIEAYGAPDRSQALAAAREEVEFAASLCSHPVNSVIAIERTIEAGEIVENFRKIETDGNTTPGAWVIEPGPSE